MGIQIKSNGRTSSVPMGIATGLLGSILMTLLLSALIAWAVGNGVLDEGYIGYGVMIMMIVTSLMGAAVSYHKIKRRKMMVSLISGVSYYVFLLAVTALFFGGQYAAVGETALLVLCGSMVFALITVPVKTQNRRKYRKLSL